jgi:hypothetical protein
MRRRNVPELVHIFSEQDCGLRVCALRRDEVRDGPFDLSNDAGEDRVGSWVPNVGIWVNIAVRVRTNRLRIIQRNGPIEITQCLFRRVVICVARRNDLSRVPGSVELSIRLSKHQNLPVWVASDQLSRQFDYIEINWNALFRIIDCLRA